MLPVKLPEVGALHRFNGDPTPISDQIRKFHPTLRIPTSRSCK
jgi:hypothetical protein